VILFQVVRFGEGLQYYEERHREQRLQLLTQRAARLGLLLAAPEIA
jgi:hypothetical protein